MAVHYQRHQRRKHWIHSIGIDPGFSSQGLLVVTEFLKEEEKIRVTFAEEFEKSNPQDFSQSDIQNICY
jgi:hypothetical protein